jgi:hypothetical protein
MKKLMHKITIFKILKKNLFNNYNNIINKK